MLFKALPLFDDFNWDLVLLKLTLNFMNDAEIKVKENLHDLTQREFFLIYNVASISWNV